MKLVTFRTKYLAEDRLGLIRDDHVIDVLAASPRVEFSSMVALIEAGPAVWAHARACLGTSSTRNTIQLADVELRAPIPVPPQFRDSMCFHQHIRQASFSIARRNARESGSPERIAAAEEYVRSYALPDIYRRQPVYYKGNRFNVAHPNEDIPWPAYSQLMDFELELAAVIGWRVKDLQSADASNAVFGYTIFNDFSARDAQAVEMQGMLGPAKGKDFDKANAFGPCIVTADELGDPHALRMIAKVNGEVWCDESSSTMNWKFGDLLAHISRGETLYPGEIVASGTVGNGCGLEHERYLQHGDVVELEIEKIGVLRNRVIRPELLERYVA
jgi:2-keto-4-pentenoate hydratase/2-oxohepta-3-ene-1,7-dioic acid hydratase in catechol pathway